MMDANHSGVDRFRRIDTGGPRPNGKLYSFTTIEYKIENARFLRLNREASLT